MARPIVHHRGWFFEWSTIVDAPVSKAMSRSEFETYYRKQRGSIGMVDLASRFDRAVAYGTSFHDNTSAEDLISGNRAGPEECELSFGDLLLLVGVPKEDL